MEPNHAPCDPFRDTASRVGDNFPPLSSPPCDCWPTLRPFGDRQVPLSLITDTVHSFPGYGGGNHPSLPERSAREGGTLQQQEGSYFFATSTRRRPPMQSRRLLLSPAYRSIHSQEQTFLRFDHLWPASQQQHSAAAARRSPALQQPPP